MFRHSSWILIAVLAAVLLPGDLRAEDGQRVATSTDGSPRVEPRVGEAGPKPSSVATSLHQWLVNRMVKWQPTGRSFIKAAIETPEEGLDRYRGIADAMIRVAYDPDEKPIFGGKYGRAKTLALMTSVSYFESGWRKDVEYGLGSVGVGDNGRSWCMMQILLGRLAYHGNTKNRISVTEDGYYKLHTSPKDQTLGWGGKDLVQDRMKCFRVGLRLIRRSFHACRQYNVRDRLGVYGSGGCIRNWKPSRVRVKKAQSWLAEDKPPMTDDEAMALLHPPKPYVNDEEVALLVDPWPPHLPSRVRPGPVRRVLLRPAPLPSPEGRVTHSQARADVVR